jgi:hypothetical protein
MMRGYVGSLVVFAVVVTAACGGGNTPPQGGQTAPGADRTAKTGALETGANLMQAKAPVEKIAMYLNGFHVSKDDPKMQMEAHPRISVSAGATWMSQGGNRPVRRANSLRELASPGCFPGRAAARCARC